MKKKFDYIRVSMNLEVLAAQQFFVLLSGFIYVAEVNVFIEDLILESKFCGFLYFFLDTIRNFDCDFNEGRKF